MSAFPEIQSGYDYGNELLGDKQLSEEEKNKIEQDMDSLGQEFQNLQKDINNEQDRSEMVPNMSVYINEYMKDHIFELRRKIQLIIAVMHTT